MDWTWRERLRFFAIGAFLTAISTLLPVGVTLWDWITHWGATPIDWPQIGRLALACAAAPVYQYFREHRALLKMPPGLILPPEFAPVSRKSKTVEVKEGVVIAASGQPIMATEKTTIERESHPLTPTSEDKP